jgi:hypothetical protein
MARDKYLANCETQLQNCKNPTKQDNNEVAPANNAVAPATNAVAPANNAVAPANNAVAPAGPKQTTQPTVPKPTTQLTVPKPTTQLTVPKPTTQQTSISSILTDKINDLKSSSVQTSKLGKGLCDSNYGCCTRKSACSKGDGIHEVNKNAQSYEMYITKVSDNFNAKFLDYFGSEQSPKFIMEMLSKKAGKPIDQIAYCKKCLKVFCPDNFNEKMLDRPVAQSKLLIPTSKNTCSFQYGCCAKDSGCSKGNGIHEEMYITKDSTDFDAKILDFQGSKESPKFLMDIFSKKSGVEIDKLSYCKNCLKVFCPDKIIDKDFILSV